MKHRTKQHRSAAIAGLVLALVSWIGTPQASAAETEAMRSPVNQLFQFTYSAPCPAWTQRHMGPAAVYLWIPETCRKVRGLVIMAANVPEQMLVGHPAIRKACADHDLGLIWAIPSFWTFAKDVPDKEKVDYLQQLLEGLANVSGYEEVATAPWLPMGESGHLLMVVGTVDQRPERCMAAVCIKNPQYPKNRTVPMLWTLGTAQEWGQKKTDVRSAWLGKKGWGTEKNWPLSSLVEPGSGHFYCTDRMAVYFGKYIAAAAKARLSDDGSPTLKPVPIEQGYLAWLPSPTEETPAVTSYAQTPEKDRNKPWFFTEELAKEAQAFSKVNWKADTQMPTATNGVNCTIDQFTFQDSICDLKISTASEFGFSGALLEKIPEGFVGAGGKLAVTPGSPEVAWICGPFAPIGGGKFKIALDRSWLGSATCYAAIIKPGTDTVRYSLQPVHFGLSGNNAGAKQTIAFDPIPDVKSGTESVPLNAKSDSGLPVEFYVQAGLAIVKDGKLFFTRIPPRSKFPVEVTVVAWQWGKPEEPKVRTAEPVKQTFKITAQ